MPLFSRNEDCDLLEKPGHLVDTISGVLSNQIVNVDIEASLMHKSEANISIYRPRDSDRLYAFHLDPSDGFAYPGRRKFFSRQGVFQARPSASA